MEWILVALLSLLVIVLLVSRQKQSKVKESLSESLQVAEERNRDLIEELKLANEKYSKVAKYESIVDVEAKRVEIIDSATKTAEELVAKANQDVEEANRVISLRTLEAEVNIAKAKSEAELLVSEATKKAEELASEALKALNSQKELEKTVKAMKNVVEGYGDQYLKPTYSLLDDLAEEFGHTEAGEKLKEARSNVNNLIKQKNAAKCDYVEEYRRNTAINFVLDAFNGKVDSILSKVKKDNYGTLEQKIRDSFQLVNNNGKAFRDAVITTEYLDARLEELKWAVVAQELKWKEQEEQRIIKEQIREEEKARREYEKAIRDAQKEEETLKRLIEKAQKEVSQATEEQKAKFEERVRDLEDKLREAEEKNQRALSMAQQTKSGNVYIISNIGSFGENVYKIGMTRRLEPLDRIRELGDASVPFEFDVHSLIYSEDAPALERSLHKKFLRLQMNKVNPRKEFFRISLADIKNEVDKLGINVKWTMTAEARQYKESLAIEQAILNDKTKQQEWEKHQLEFEEADSKRDEEIESVS